jgi:hypothetical protein
MSKPCEVVAERVALGESIGELADHAAQCARCRRLAALPSELGAMRQEADPGLGFAARMTAGAQQRIIVRRRRRVATAAIAAAAAASLLTFALTREPAQTSPQPAAELKQPVPDNDADETDDVRALVQLADTDRAGRASANWGAIEKPLKPYRSLVQGVTP